ncbi:MAG: hypothetical protein U0703_11730 [Anaerolineae bacterium]
MTQLSPQSTGLTSAQVAERVARGESNHYRSRVGRTYWQIIRDNLLNLFNIVFGALLITVLSFRDYSTAFFAGFSVVTNTFMGMLQEIFAKRKLDTLATLALSDVQVWRDGVVATISISQIVMDDVLPLEPGDKIMVDEEIISSDALEIDESQLTGESDAVMKNAATGCRRGRSASPERGHARDDGRQGERHQPALRPRQAVPARPDA